ncbi:hypothetical protein [Hydrocarboniphaga sp.]|uniref:hypothetical protein n=1 Tax=Hydrocarboniphaga sp. TaxID=2033016 RepID=UPI003D1042F3
MQTLGRGALEPLLIGIALAVGGAHGVEVGYDSIGRAFLTIGIMLIGAAALYYFDIRSRNPAATRRAAAVNTLGHAAD